VASEHTVAGLIDALVAALGPSPVSPGTPQS
jgi:hypothetical protein